MSDILEFYKGKKVFVTGHTGFKGSWLLKILKIAGADVTGYALTPPTEPSLFEISHAADNIKSVTGDIRDFDAILKAVKAAEPEIVFHLAAQPIVAEGYRNPRYTFDTNIMGTVNILEGLRLTGSVKSFLNVTTDKVYKSNENACREDAPLGGSDPYSGSKSCSELVTHSYKQSFLNGIAVSTARAGNVIGGGDFAEGRIIPDCVRAAQKGEDIIVRNPNSVRPFQHVLEPLFAYLLIAKKQYEDISFEGSYNIAPEGGLATGQLTTLFCKEWGSGQKWITAEENRAVSKSDAILLNCDKFKKAFGKNAVWNINEAVSKTVEWTKVYCSGGDTNAVMEKQIKEYFTAVSKNHGGCRR